LEAADLVVKQGIKGRVITPKGMSLLDKTSTQIAKDIEKGNPDLAIYF
jgi:ribosomal protein S19E (S16A)